MKSRTNSNQLINKNDVELEKTHTFSGVDICDSVYAGEGI